MDTRINGLRVLEAASLVLKADEAISLYPFEDFELRFSFEFQEDVSPIIRRLAAEEGKKQVFYRFVRPFRVGEKFSNTSPLVFAEDNTKGLDYYVNCAVSSIGDKKTYTLIFHYTIVERRV